MAGRVLVIGAGASKAATARRSPSMPLATEFFLQAYLEECWHSSWMRSGFANKVSLLRQGTLQISGWDAEGEIRVVELRDHPFFFGTLFVPQLRSIKAKPHPLVTAFVQAVIGNP